MNAVAFKSIKTLIDLQKSHAQIAFNERIRSTHGTIAMSISKPVIAVLIADDDPQFRDMAVACLEEAGMIADTASEGAAAMAMLVGGTYDLAIIELDTPRIDGLRLIALIRSTPRLRSLPVLVITAQQDPHLIAESSQVGANGYLTKPVDWAALPSEVLALVNPEP